MKSKSLNMKTMVKVLGSLSIGLALTACSNGFSSGSADGGSTGIPTLPAQGSLVDVAGRGGSIGLLQVGKVENKGTLFSMSAGDQPTIIDGIPTIIGAGGLIAKGGWTTRCIVGNNSSARIDLVMDGFYGYMVSSAFIANTECDPAALDHVETRMYQYSNHGTAPVPFAANTLAVWLVGAYWMPYTEGARNDVTVCGYTRQQIDDWADNDEAINISLCSFSGVTRTHDVSYALFYTDGNILRLDMMSAGTLDSPGQIGYFYKIQ